MSKESTLKELTPQQKRNIRRNFKKKILKRVEGFNKELALKPTNKVINQFLKDAKTRRKKQMLAPVLIDEYKWLNRKLGKY
jgi:hypothetical protein